MHPPRRRLASRLILLSCSLLGLIALSACSAPGGKGPGVDAGGSHSASGGASSSGAAAGANAASGSGVGSSAGTGPTLDLDAGTGDDDATAGCMHLNIGILGNPGSNASSNFEQWLTRSGTSVTRIQTTADEPMTSATLAPFDVIVLDRLTRDYTAAEAVIFGAWVAAGGGAAAMSGYQDDTMVDWRANSLLAPLGVAYSGNLLSGPVTSFVAHPITAGLTSVTFTGGYAVADLGGTGSTRTALAFVPGTPPVTAAIAVQMGGGHAFVWGDEWIEFDSEWSSLPQIPQLWVQVFGWISPMSKCSLTPPK